MSSAGEFLEAAFKEFYPAFVLRTPYAEIADRDLEKSLFARGVTLETFKECVSWHIKNNRQFLPTVIKQCKNPTMPHWGIVVSWNKLVVDWSAERYRQVDKVGSDEEPLSSNATLADLDDVKHDRLTKKRAMEISQHAKRMVKVKSKAASLYQKIVDVSERQE